MMLALSYNATKHTIEHVFNLMSIKKNSFTAKNRTPPGAQRD